MECIILAGGLGTRLRSVVDKNPKALALIGDKPFLSFIIDNLLGNKISKFIFSLGYLHEQIEAFLIEKYPTLNYKCVIETELLGTGGAILNSLSFCTSLNILVVNADTFLEIDIIKMFKFHEEKNSICTISLKKMFDFNRYGSVCIDSNKKIIDFKEKEYTSEGYVNTGYIIINRNLFKNIEKKIFSFEQDILYNNFSKNNMYGFENNGYFIDIGIPEDYEKFNLEYKNIFLENHTT